MRTKNLLFFLKCSFPIVPTNHHIRLSHTFQLGERINNVHMEIGWNCIVSNYTTIYLYPIYLPSYQEEETSIHVCTMPKDV